MIDMLRKVSFLVLYIVSLVISTQTWSEDWSYRLREGENLTQVAERFLKSEFTPEQLQVYNSIDKDREIPIGTEIRAPIDWLKEVLAGVKVSHVLGEATLQRRGKDERSKLQAETLLNAGDRIATGAGSAVSLKFADDSLLLIGENSEVVFDALSSFHGMGMLDTRIRLQRGRVENRVRPLAKPESRYEIHTPAAVTLVRGTDFRVFVDADGAQTRHEVTEGEVAVSAAGETVSLSAGEGTLVERGEAPRSPRKLLLKPDLSELRVLPEGDRLLLEWPVLAGAVDYRFQLMNAVGKLLSRGRVEAGRADLARPPAGEYRFSVRGIDLLGLEGEDAFSRFDLQPVSGSLEPPRPTLPALLLHRPQFHGNGIAVSWTPVAEAWSYRLILARDAGLQDVLFERLADDQGFLLPPLFPGRYYIGLEALFSETDETSRSNIYRIEIPGLR
ncbi:MAG: FecR domain-containing protein [Candidatus Thiodiazotropha sp. (ex Epidulcina cf. delphinae)]|nr:FecR domain-containing protein [Candidatus Thiodiazotropha sp. (ex Epidulcina cf. delphinae)]